MRVFRLVTAFALVVAVVLTIVIPATARVEQGAATITVTGTEFKFKLSAKSVAKGSHTFKFLNKGKVPHDFKINGKKTKIIAKGKSASLTVRFTKPGKYAYLCTLPGHAAGGMKGTLTVK
jgi:uncharacterized cupredoxin-like copper-binding protein